MEKNGISPVASQGLYGLPHFRASRVSTSMWEPVYMNLFTVDIQLPDAVREKFDDSEKNLLLEGITKVDGLDTQKVPNSSTEQRYKFATRRFADAGPTETTLDVKFDIEINVRGSVEGKPDMYTMKILRAWNDLLFDPLTGRMSLKAEYVAPWVKIIMHDKAYQPFWEWDLHHVFPNAKLPAPNLAYETKNGIYKVAGYSLACDYWDEYML